MSRFYYLENERIKKTLRYELKKEFEVGSVKDRGDS